MLQSAWKALIARGLATDPNGWHAVHTCYDLAECVAAADYVQESVPEALDVKQDMLAKLDNLVAPGVLIGSSTSFLPLSICSAACSRHPDRVVIVHPFQGHLASFVEVFSHDPSLGAWLCEFWRAHVGFDVIVIKHEKHCHIFNTFLQAIGAQASALVGSQTASAADVDCALKHLGAILFAAGGRTGCNVGFVGGGEIEASANLGADIAIGYPLARLSTVVTWYCGRGRLARFLQTVLRILFAPWLASPTVRSFARRFLGERMRAFNSLWEEMRPDFEERSLRKLRLLQLAETGSDAAAVHSLGKARFLKECGSPVRGG